MGCHRESVRRTVPRYQLASHASFVVAGGQFKVPVTAGVLMQFEELQTIRNKIRTASGSDRPRTQASN